MRLIDADALIIKVRDLVEKYEHRIPYWSMNDMLTSGRDAAAKWGYKADGVEDVLKLIIDAPIVKAETIKHGRWVLSEVRDSKTLCCSICGLDSGTIYEYSYCPRCGAIMDEVGEND